LANIVRVVEIINGLRIVIVHCVQVLVVPHRRLISFCCVTEIRDVGRLPQFGSRQRGLFLFNDLLLARVSLLLLLLLLLLLIIIMIIIKNNNNNNDDDVTSNCTCILFFFS